MIAIATHTHKSLKYLQERSFKTFLKIINKRIIRKNINNRHLNNEDSSSNFGERILLSKINYFINVSSKQEERE